MRKNTWLKIIFALVLLFNFSSTNAARNKCKTDPTPLVNLVSNPKKFLGKKITIEGRFHSFSTLALDYKPAMRESKDFIGIVLSRPDQIEIPLVELKIATPLEQFKNNSVSVEHGDIVSMRGKVYAVALGEPWLDIEDIVVEKKVND